MYCDYWNLTKPPFDNVPDSSMYVDCHVSMENVISETIFAIKEGNECLSVIIGEVGLGKTLSLRIIIDSLEPEKYKVALITNPSISFIQLLREIIGQITGKQCEEKKKVDLLEIFNRLLFETADQGKKIVIVIDESNVLSSANLDDLRLLTNMQDDEHNLFTLILAGQMELAQKLEHPKRANLFQRIGTYGHIEKLPSEEAVKTYIESRLNFAGTQQKIFSDEAIPVIWEFSEHGVPRLINKLCKLCLKAGETNEFKIISGEVASQIADRFQKLSKTTFQKRKPQSPPEIELSKEDISDEPEVKELKKKPKTSIPKKTTPKVKASSTPITSQLETMPIETKDVSPAQVTSTPIPPQWETIPVEVKAAPPAQTSSTHIPSQLETMTVETKEVSPEQVPSTPIPLQREATPVEIKAVPLARASSTYVPLQQEAKIVETKAAPSAQASSTQEEKKEQPTKAEKEIYEEVLIGQQKVKLSIPNHIIRQAKLASSESKNKLAGYWSAQIIKENPHMMHSPLIDPVSIWFEIKNVILKKFDGASNTNTAMKSL